MSTPGALIGIGLDTVDVPRFGMVLGRRPGLVERLFSEGERAYSLSRANPAPSLAARFAAKEATMKSLGVGLGAFEWLDVEVVRLESGAPRLRVSGRALALSEERGVTSWEISLTHTATVASAVVAALGAPG
ncbi:MAG: holo-ACP synthase [Acidimicrobiales bacterium]